MARKSILNTYYIFDPAAKQVVIPGGIPREKLILITNVTDNKVIYNFSDPELTASAYSIETDIRNTTTTRVTLSYDTTSMNAADKLQIVYDDFEETIQPAETYHDAVNKMRVSTPQSQIDTDFEYGTQSTKWESLSTINNNPFAYKSETPLTITDVQATQNSKTITATTTDTRPAVGTSIFVQDTEFPGANGVFIVDSHSSQNSNDFTYTAAYEWTQGPGTIWNSARTAFYLGLHYTGSSIGGNITVTAVGDGGVSIETSVAHGLEIGNEIAVTGDGGDNVNGSWVVARVLSPTQFYYYPDAAPTGSVGTGTANVYPRPQGNSVHRAFDGGVKFSTNSFSKNQAAIRQTKRYFRYQSGKGVAFSTGSILAPAIENIDSIAYTGANNIVRVISAVAHNVTRDTIIDVRGVNDNNYNGQYQVSNVIDAFTFEYVTGNTPVETAGAGEYTITPINSYGTKLEIGMMDQQNGIFFRYSDGQLSVVRRSSTFQISGKVTVTQGSTLVSSYTGVNGAGTRFAKQLKPGDFVVIRGSSYRIDGIISDTQMVIFPDYRGPSAINVPVSKTSEIEWKQGEWNIDRCDGTGKSGYDLDLTKMQMFYMDYSWYGAGFIRWGFRGADGNVIYAHKIPNNNFNTEAYMRSGNLPARYEVNTIPPALITTKTVSSSDTTVYVDKAPLSFPPTGTLRLKKQTANTTGTYEYINYTDKKEYKQDVISVDTTDDSITVASTNYTDGTALPGAGVQSVVFDRPFSNIVAGKTYYVASRLSGTKFTITDTPGSSTALNLSTQTGSALSPIAVAEAGSFTGVTREQAGGSTDITIPIGSSSGTVASSTGIQKGQRVVGDGIPSDTFVHSISGSNIILSKAVYSANPTGVKFIAMGTSGAGNTFTYSDVQPTGVELLQATSVPQISHWGSSVIMEGELDDDRAYVYTVGTKTQRNISAGDTRAILALRLAPSVDNGITGEFGTRELINRMQLVLRQVDISATGKFFVELVLNPVPDTNNNWIDVGGTSLAQYSVLSTATDLLGGEVIYGFYADNDVKAYDLSAVKEISNCILGGGTSNYANTTAPNPTGIFPDGPEVLAVRVTNIAGGNKSVDARFSWTEAQA